MTTVWHGTPVDYPPGVGTHVHVTSDTVKPPYYGAGEPAAWSTDIYPAKGVDGGFIPRAQTGYTSGLTWSVRYKTAGAGILVSPEKWIAKR